MPRRFELTNGWPSDSCVCTQRAPCSFWGECYRPLKGGKEPEAGAEYANSERFTKWLVTLQGPLRCCPSGSGHLISPRRHSAAARQLAACRSPVCRMIAPAHQHPTATHDERLPPCATRSTGGADYLFGSSPTFADYHLLATVRAIDEMYPKVSPAAAVVAAASMAAEGRWSVSRVGVAAAEQVFTQRVGRR